MVAVAAPPRTVVDSRPACKAAANTVQVVFLDMREGLDSGKRVFDL